MQNTVILKCFFSGSVLCFCVLWEVFCYWDLCYVRENSEPHDEVAVCECVDIMCECDQM